MTSDDITGGGGGEGWKFLPRDSSPALTSGRARGEPGCCPLDAAVRCQIARAVRRMGRDAQVSTGCTGRAVCACTCAIAPGNTKIFGDHGRKFWRTNISDFYSDGILRQFSTLDSHNAQTQGCWSHIPTPPPSDNPLRTLKRKVRSTLFVYEHQRLLTSVMLKSERGTASPPSRCKNEASV